MGMQSIPLPLLLLLAALLEAGGEDRHPLVRMPSGFLKALQRPNLTWGFESEPEPHLNGRRLPIPRGRLLGGSSSINGMFHFRGHRLDFDEWRDLGCTGWGYDDVLPYFIKSERNQRGASTYHGGDGPLSVSDIGERNELIEAFIGGAGQIGVPRTDDFNGAQQEGAGYYQLTTWKGWRWSTAKGYLGQARGRPNLRVQTEAQAAGLVMDNRRAVGVRYRQGGQMKTARCRGEVLLAAGAIQSPQLLQLSGIGPADLLRHRGVPVVRDLPGVGENLQDHLQLRLMYKVKKPITTNDDLQSWWRQFKMGWKWITQRKGPLAIGINQGGMFTRILPESTTPDIQFHFASVSAEMAGAKPHPWSGCTFSVCQLRPHSRGTVFVKSRDPLQAPSMLPNYLSHETDRRCAVESIKFARHLAAAPALGDYIREEYRPGPGVANDEETLDWARNYGATIFHPSGTCKMGDDAMAVVDARLRVHGLTGLRVVDCSIMPTLVSGNTNSPVVMIAEKASDMILQDQDKV